MVLCVISNSQTKNTSKTHFGSFICWMNSKKKICPCECIRMVVYLCSCLLIIYIFHLFFSRLASIFLAFLLLMHYLFIVEVIGLIRIEQAILRRKCLIWRADIVWHLLELLTLFPQNTKEPIFEIEFILVAREWFKFKELYMNGENEAWHSETNSQNNKRNN